MFVVKKLSKNGVWNVVSFIDQNGSFRGEAKFDSKQDALNYLLVYKQRTKTRENLKVFSE
jgi:hypothetical protein